MSMLVSMSKYIYTALMHGNASSQPQAKATQMRRMKASIEQPSQSLDAHV